MRSTFYPGTQKQSEHKDTLWQQFCWIWIFTLRYVWERCSIWKVLIQKEGCGMKMGPTHTFHDMLSTRFYWENILTLFSAFTLTQHSQNKFKILKTINHNLYQQLFYMLKIIYNLASFPWHFWYTVRYRICCLSIAKVLRSLVNATHSFVALPSVKNHRFPHMQFQFLYSQIAGNIFFSWMFKKKRGGGILNFTSWKVMLR